MSVRKDFSSLKKHRHTGVLPKNLLGAPAQTIGIPTDETFNQGAMYVVNPADVTYKTRSQDVKTCFHLPIAIIDSGLSEVPALTLDVATVTYNGSKIVALGERELLMNLSKNGKFLFFVRSKAYLDKMVMPQDAIRHAVFSTDDRNALFILQKKFGLIYVNFALKATKLREYLRSEASDWIGGKILVETQNYIEELYHYRLSKRENSKKDPETVVRKISSPEASEVATTSDDVLQNGLPSKLTSRLFQGRKTRATTKMLEDDPELYALYSEKSIDYEEDEDLIDEDLPVIQETPAPFDPPLKYTLSNGKKFIIAHSDFKTLYNNDWINDTLIDFFIAFEIDRAATELQLIKADAVYAFNSFFFTKLMSKPEEQEVPDYYGNIRRWLTKIDLMSYESVILPINEHLHWFCAVIKNLPLLVEAAIAYHEKYGPSPEDKETGKRPKVDAVVEVFVFDSLRQTHSDIAKPLRIVIDEYCKDKYGVLIPPELIKVQSARVPKQRNFNDCGIHVIYNVRKWLSEPEVCERVWRKFGRSQRTYFNGSERNGMRRACIDFLLDLHQKQPKDETSNSANNDEDGQSDDEIELISYHSSKPEEIDEKDGTTPTDQAQTNLTEPAPPAEAKTVDIERSLNVLSTDSKIESKDQLPRSEETLIMKTAQSKSKPLVPARTLDPRVLEEAFSPTGVKSGGLASNGKVGTKNVSNTKFLPLDKENQKKVSVESRLADAFQIEHPQIRRLCIMHRLKPHSLQFLNNYFVNHSRKYDEAQQKTIVEFVKNYNFFDPLTEAKQCERLISSFKDELRQPPPPIDEPFVIQEADDSSGELNQSVSDLRISSEDSGRSKYMGDTPEATRRFMREADLVSPVRNSKFTDSPTTSLRHTRSQKSLENDGSDLEVLGDDEVLIIPTGTNTKFAPRKKPTEKIKKVIDVSAKLPEVDVNVQKPKTPTRGKSHFLDRGVTTSRSGDDAVTVVVSPGGNSHKTTQTVVSIPDEDFRVRKVASPGGGGVSIVGGSKRRRVESHSDKSGHAYS